jgi:hypothetical protein
MTSPAPDTSYHKVPVTTGVGARPRLYNAKVDDPSVFNPMLTTGDAVFWREETERVLIAIFRFGPLLGFYPVCLREAQQKLLG